MVARDMIRRPIELWLAFLWAFHITTADTFVRVGNAITPSLSGVDTESIFLLPNVFPTSGRLFAFRSIFRNQQALYFQIWRPSTSDVSSKNFTLLAQFPWVPTTVNSQEDAYIDSMLTSQCLTVQAGDRLGLFFSQVPGSVPYIFNKAETTDGALEVTIHGATSNAAPGATLLFNSPTFPYDFSVAAYLDTSISSNTVVTQGSNCPQVTIPSDVQFVTTGQPPINGKPGLPGLVGPPGSTGGTGPYGALGATGAPGPLGAPGRIGATGAQGAIGQIAPTGQTGQTGPAGATGQMGLVGATGITGPMGPPGIPSNTFKECPPIAAGLNASAGEVDIWGNKIFILAWLIWLAGLSLLLLILFVCLLVLLCTHPNRRRRRPQQHPLHQTSTGLKPLPPSAVDVETIRRANGGTLNGSLNNKSLFGIDNKSANMSGYDASNKDSNNLGYDTNKTTNKSGYNTRNKGTSKSNGTLNSDLTTTGTTNTYENITLGKTGQDTKQGGEKKDEEDWTRSMREEEFKERTLDTLAREAAKKSMTRKSENYKNEGWLSDMKEDEFKDYAVVTTTDGRGNGTNKSEKKRYKFN